MVSGDGPRNHHLFHFHRDAPSRGHIRNNRWTQPAVYPSPGAFVYAGLPYRSPCRTLCCSNVIISAFNDVKTSGSQGDRGKALLADQEGLSSGVIIYERIGV